MKKRGKDMELGWRERKGDVSKYWRTKIAHISIFVHMQDQATGAASYKLTTCFNSDNIAQSHSYSVYQSLPQSVSHSLSQYLSLSPCLSDYFSLRDRYRTVTSKTQRTWYMWHQKQRSCAVYLAGGSTERYRVREREDVIGRVKWVSGGC